MKLIVGLWNPWTKYIKTRHNVWFLFLDYLIKTEKLPEFRFESKFKWEISSWNIKWEKVFLLKPQTFMNLSWDSLIQIINFYKINTEDLIVIYDDISMDFAKIRFRDKWSAGWHNWIKDIINNINDSFWRIKIWVWFDNKYEVSDWVLSKFNKEEWKTLEKEVFPHVRELLQEKL